MTMVMKDDSDNMNGVNSHGDRMIMVMLVMTVMIVRVMMMMIMTLTTTTMAIVDYEKLCDMFVSDPLCQELTPKFT